MSDGINDSYMFERMEELKEGIDRLQAVVDEFTALIAESRGVDGLHLNGDIAEWDWLMNNGWLEKYRALGGEVKP